MICDDVLAARPDLAYLADPDAVRPATAAEAAEYARRITDPEWAAIYVYTVPGRQEGGKP
jgi:hypothetical protein